MPLAVLDAWALLAWMQGEPAAAEVRRWLERAERAQDPLALSLISAGEVYYTVWRRRGEATAQAVATDLRGGRMPVRLYPASASRVWAAARLKARYPIAYADAFAVGLAQELHVPLLTGDPELAGLRGGEACRIEWLR